MKSSFGVPCSSVRCSFSLLFLVPLFLVLLFDVLLFDVQKQRSGRSSAPTVEAAIRSVYSL